MKRSINISDPLKLDIKTNKMGQCNKESFYD